MISTSSPPRTNLRKWLRRFFASDTLARIIVAPLYGIHYSHQNISIIAIIIPCFKGPWWTGKEEAGRRKLLPGSFKD